MIATPAIFTQKMTLKLCYVEDCWAYFTTADLSEQWGDDWNDAPYEHNAGVPYDSNRDKCWTVIKVAFDADLNAPCYNCLNSEWSVEQINNGQIPWLSSCDWSGNTVKIYAGTSLADFKQIITSIGGSVYEKVQSS